MSLCFAVFVDKALLDIKGKTPATVKSARAQLEAASLLLPTLFDSQHAEAASVAQGPDRDARSILADTHAELAPLGYVAGLNHHLLAPAPPRVLQASYLCLRACRLMCHTARYLVAVTFTQAPTKQEALTSWAAMLQHLQAAVEVADISGYGQNLMT